MASSATARTSGSKNVARCSKRASKAEFGGLLMETTVALALFAIVGTAVLVGLSTTHRSGAMTETQSVAENVARNQMESVFAQPYLAPPSAYPAIVTPAGYSVSAAALEYVVADPNVEKVVVTVTYSGRDILVLETLRVIN